MYANTRLSFHKTANSQNDYDFFQGNFMHTSNRCVLGFNDVMVILFFFFFFQQVFNTVTDNSE